MRYWLSTLLVLCSASVAWPQKPKANEVTDKEPQKSVEKKFEGKPTSFWMERKLELSQDAFAALASGDLEKLELSSSQMQVLSKIEGFVRRGNPDYTAHLRSFELANREITRHAKAKNLEGATLAFQQLTVSCVACHKLLRDTNQIDSAAKKKEVGK